MKTSTAIATAIITAGIVGLTPGVAKADAPEISGNVTLTSDYRFRGVSQTTRDPAIQGGFDVAFDNGIYFGTWASNINFGDDASLELDIYGGYTHTINDDSSVTVGYTRFEYPGEGNNLDYNEWGLSYSFQDLTLGVIYSEEYLALDDVTWWYPYADYSFALGDFATLSAHVGLNATDDNSAEDFESLFGDEEYVDWSLTLSKEWGGVEWALAYVDTDIDDDVCDEACNSTIVVSVSKSM